MEYLCISYLSNCPEVVNHLPKKMMISVLFVRMEGICYAVKIVLELSTLVRIFDIVAVMGYFVPSSFM